MLLAVARAAGETAPLLFTALNNQYWNLPPDQPIASLTVQIFNYAISPYEDWHQKAWTAALVLLLLVGALNLRGPVPHPQPTLRGRAMTAARRDRRSSGREARAPSSGDRPQVMRWHRSPCPPAR